MTRADIIHVDAAAWPGGDGQTWATAFDDLQDALAIAVAGDQIWVAAWAYLPSDRVDPGDARTATFYLISGVAIYGAFPPGGGDGTFGARDVNNPEYETILSGDIGVPGNNSDNAYHVVTGSGTDATAVLDGFTIIKGNANGSSAGGYNAGGGMYTFGASPTVTNCTFRGNSAVDSGGGMYNSSSSPTLTNCTFSGNGAGSGGGMYNAFESNPTLTNCTFSGNSTSDIYYGSGGGMYNNSSSPTVTNCTFSGNSATPAYSWSAGGGGMYNNSSSPTVTNCTFSGNGNWAPSGGGMRNSSSSPMVTNCTFSGNSAYKGGGMYNDSSSPTVTNCTFSGNEAGPGGGMYNSSSSPTVTNCTFSGNSATLSGGGMVNSSSGPMVTNCTFSGNSASDGGGLFLTGGSGVTIANSVFWENVAPSGSQITVLGGSTLAIRYSDAQGGLSAVYHEPGAYVYWGPAMLNADPLFVNAAGGDLRLAPGSPCLDAADDTAVPADNADLDGDGNTTERTPLDLDLAPRFIDAGAPGGTGVADPPLYPEIVDMGPYEFGADCNGNGILDPCDLDCGPPCGPCDVPGCGQSADCNTNGVPDECEPQDDCQPNGVQDICDIAAGTSQDCQPNGTPDECELTDNDCNTNSVPDDCDIAGATSEDCQANGVPDECDIAAGTSEDCQPNGIPDECDVMPPETTCCEAHPEPGCDSATIEACVCLVDAYCRQVEWDRTCVDEVTSEACGICDNDCNTNGIPDGCESDFDGDGLIDECDPDIDNDGVPNDEDACDFTPLGANIVSDPVSPLYGTLRGDLDGDCDSDLADYAILQDDFTGPNPQPWGLP